jgi:hypothetical protein
MSGGYVTFGVTVEPLTAGVRVTLDDGHTDPVIVVAATAEDALRMIAPHMAAVAELVCA